MRHFRIWGSNHKLSPQQEDDLLKKRLEKLNWLLDKLKIVACYNPKAFRRGVHLCVPARCWKGWRQEAGLEYGTCTIGEIAAEVSRIFRDIPKYFAPRGSMRKEQVPKLASVDGAC